jgi:hypothetical protein
MTFRALGSEDQAQVSTSSDYWNSPCNAYMLVL